MKKPIIRCTYCKQPLGLTGKAYRNGDLICQECWKILRYSNTKHQNSKECKKFIVERKKRFLKGFTFYPNTHHKFSNRESSGLVRG